MRGRVVWTVASGTSAGGRGVGRREAEGTIVGGDGMVADGTSWFASSVASGTGALDGKNGVASLQPEQSGADAAKALSKTENGIGRGYERFFLDRRLLFDFFEDLRERLPARPFELRECDGPRARRRFLRPWRGRLLGRAETVTGLVMGPRVGIVGGRRMVSGVESRACRIPGIRASEVEEMVPEDTAGYDTVVLVIVIINMGEKNTLEDCPTGCWGVCGAAAEAVRVGA